jgi:hypothetical protein
MMGAFSHRQQGLNKMNEFFLSENVKIEILPSSELFGDANLLVASNGSQVAAGKILTQADGNIATLISESTGSEHWYTEESDFFRFYDSGHLHSLILSVPDENAMFDGHIPHPEPGYFSVKLSSKIDVFTIPPQSYRSFNPLRRELHCFTEKTIPKTVFKITSDLAIIFDENNIYIGWILYQPVENITKSYQGKKDIDAVDDYTYHVFEDYFEIFSDNEVFAFDYENKEVVKKLLNEIDLQRVSKIQGNERREVLQKCLQDLKTRYIDK